MLPMWSVDLVGTGYSDTSLCDCKEQIHCQGKPKMFSHSSDWEGWQMVDMKIDLQLSPEKPEVGRNDQTAHTASCELQ